MTFGLRIRFSSLSILLTPFVSSFSTHKHVSSELFMGSLPDYRVTETTTQKVVYYIVFVGVKVFGSPFALCKDHSLNDTRNKMR